MSLDILLKIIFLGVLFLFLIWNEKKMKRSRFVFRLMLNMLFFFSLCALVLGDFSKAIKKDILLITDGYLEQQKDSLKQVYPDAEVFLATSEKFRDVFSFLHQKDKMIKRIHILGYGFSEAEWEALSIYPLTFYGAQKPKGVVRVKSKSEVQKGDTISIFLKVNKLENLASIKLEGFSSVLDSVLLGTKETEIVHLKSVAIHPGDFLFRVIGRSSTGDTLFCETLPIIIKENLPLRILCFLETPNVEVNRLKNWLSKQKHHVLMRTKLVGRQYRYEALHTKMPKTSFLAPNVLSEQDLVLTDIFSFLSLKRKKRSSLLKVVKEKGLGLLFLVSGTNVENLKEPNIKRYFSVKKRKQDIELSLQESLGLKEEHLGSVSTYLEKKELPIVSQISFGNKIIVGSFFYGLGTITLNMLEDTYTWRSLSQRKAYNAFWKKLLSETAKKKKQSIRIIPMFSFERERTHMDLGTAKKAAWFDSKGSSVKLSILENVTDRGTFLATLFPMEKGWNMIETPEYRQRFYVHEQEAWKSYRNVKRWETSKNYVNLLKGKNLLKKGEEYYFPIQPFFLIICFLSYAGLWLEEKL